MNNLIIIISLLLTSCNFVSKVDSKKTNASATCRMNGFRGFPSKVTAPIVVEYKDALTLAIINDKGTERVDMTFVKSRCTW